MPTPGQYKLFERLRKDHGDTPRWRFLMRGNDFGAMTTHRAGHFLAGLLTAFLGVRARNMCDPTFPRRLDIPVSLSFRKTPGDSTPSAPDAQTV
jgi:hypothetical protein